MAASRAGSAFIAGDSFGSRRGIGDGERDVGRWVTTCAGGMAAAGAGAAAGALSRWTSSVKNVAGDGASEFGDGALVAGAGAAGMVDDMMDVNVGTKMPLCA